MKTSITKLGLALLSCVFALSSCTKNDPADPTPTPTPDPKPVTATITYTMEDRVDLIKFADMNVKYTDAAGKEVSEVVKTSTWTKTIENAPVPGTYKLSISYVRNQTAFDKEQYTFGTGAIIEYTLSSGTTIKKGIAAPYTVDKAEANDWIDFMKDTEKTTVELNK